MNATSRGLPIVYKNESNQDKFMNATSMGLPIVYKEDAMFKPSGGSSAKTPGIGRSVFIQIRAADPW